LLLWWCAIGISWAHAIRARWLSSHRAGAREAVDRDPRRRRPLPIQFAFRQESRYILGVMDRRRSNFLSFSTGFRARPRMSPAASIIEDARQDREDRADLDAALDKLERGELETISHAELKASLGLD
jgi:hypothetical protein